MEGGKGSLLSEYGCIKGPIGKNGLDVSKEGGGGKSPKGCRP